MAFAAEVKAMPAERWRRSKATWKRAQSALKYLAKFKIIDAKDPALTALDALSKAPADKH